MKIKESILMDLAKMICGDQPYQEVFPYRTSYYLSQFFHNLSLDYTHDGSTRYKWVFDCLKFENSKEIDKDSLPQNMIKIIENIVSPEHFVSNKETQLKVVEKINEVLQIEGMEIELDSRRSPSLHYLSENFISSGPKQMVNEERITFSPLVFEIPSKSVDEKLVSVMMPFDKSYDSIYSAIENACNNLGLKCQRADNIWENSTIIQDIFELIFVSKIVVVDFSDKKPNVMYETGIAHTLGKTVIPISRSVDDIPFDLRHHRVLGYLPNNEGVSELEKSLEEKISNIIGIQKNQSRNSVLRG